MKHRKFTNLNKKKIYSQKSRRVETLALLMLVFLIMISAFVGFVSYQLKVYTDAIPSVEEIKAEVTDKGQNSILYDREGRLLYEFKDPNRDREYVEIENIPSNVILPLIAAEDESFYRHIGIDYAAILRSASILIQSRGETVIGGSTITQQLVKNTVLTNEKTLQRKVKEMLISLIVEREYTKDQILEMYLNSASFGGRVTGIKAASRAYFNKNLNELNLAESVFLVSLIQTPGESSPLFSNNEQIAWDLVNRRKQYVFNQINKNYDYFKQLDPNFYSREDLELSRAEAVELNPSIGFIEAPHFVFYIKQVLEAEPFLLTEDQIYNGGYHIYSSLDLDLQKIVETKLAEGIQERQRYGMNNGAAVVMDPRNGDILAMVGSKDYWGEKDEDGKFDPHVNVAISDRNLGSSLKPFIAYEAFRQEKFRPTSIVVDQPTSFGSYKPKNSDGSFMGAISVTEALIRSRNIPFVFILDKVGVGSALNILYKLGYADAIHTDRYGLSLALGGFNSNLVEHVRGYTALAGNGLQPRIRPILRITDGRDSVFWESRQSTNQVLESEYVQMVNGILAEYGIPGTYGKTGTTDGNRDTYYIGYTERITMGVWTGNNNNARMANNAFGSTTAQPIWDSIYLEMIKQLPEYKAEKALPVPPRSVIRVNPTPSPASDTNQPATTPVAAPSGLPGEF